MTSTMADQSDNIMSRDDVLRLLDEQARQFLGMTGEQFVAAARAGTLPDHPTVAHLCLLAGEGGSLLGRTPTRAVGTSTISTSR